MELKPCPFCGAPMTLAADGGLWAWHKVDCFFQWLDEHEVDLTEAEINDEFIKAWNRRYQMSDITKEPYAEWLEEALRDMVGLRPVSIGLVVLLPDGTTGTNYWQADGADRWAMIRSIAQDSLLDWIRVNADTIQEILDGEEDSDADA